MLFWLLFNVSVKWTNTSIFLEHFGPASMCSLHSTEQVEFIAVCNTWNIHLDGLGRIGHGSKRLLKTPYSVHCVPVFCKKILDSTVGSKIIQALERIRVKKNHS